MRCDSSAGNAEISRKLATCRSGSTSRCVSAFGAMSRIATKPSAAWRWSPSRTSWQKRQSSGSEDPLLRDGAGTDPDDPADRGLDEPRRVVVAVASAGAVDQHLVLLADLAPPPPHAGQPGDLSEAGAALPLAIGRHRIRSRRGG